jgi:K+-transporting ATPase KdpF subunit
MIPGKSSQDFVYRVPIGSPTLCGMEWLALALSVVLGIYLLVALLYPERFE